MKKRKELVHYVHPSLTQPTNPVIVNLIGAGGTGSQVLTHLARINHALQQLEHPGLFVRLFDDDTVSTANLGRQLFTAAEVGQYKSVALMNRLNRFFGTNWKAIPEKFGSGLPAESNSATLNISCVDTAAARFQIADVLSNHSRLYNGRGRALYWLDFGNSRQTGQMVLSTLKNIEQPNSNKYLTVGELPLITAEFQELLLAADETDHTPSCSLAEALTKQDLFINTALAGYGASLLWQMLREGVVAHRGFFLNLRDYRTQPISLAG